MTQKTAVLINLSSGRGNGKGQALLRQLEGQPHITVQALRRFADFKPVMDAFAQAGVTDLFISSGDGTVQAVMTHLAESGLWQAMPRLGVLPHGTTNLSAGDIGFKPRSIAAQAKFILSGAKPALQQRHSLRIANPKAEPPRHGLTLGAGAAAAATRHAQLAFNDKGVKGGFASFATMASGMAKAAFAKPNPEDTTRLDKPCPMAVDVAGKRLIEGPQTMLVATTLEKLFFKTRPFWGGKQGPVRATSFPYPVPNILRWALPMMYGGENRKAPKGAISFSGHGFEIACAEAYVMDGEFFHGPEDGKLRVEAGPLFSFITGPAKA